MPRSDEQLQRWKLLAQSKKNSDKDFFFAAMRAATKQHHAIRGSTRRRLPQRRSYSVALCLNIRIEFDAAGYMHPVCRDTEHCPSLDVSRFWYTHQIEEPECRCDKKSKPSIASLRTRRQTRVYQREGNSAHVRYGDEVRPNLCFNKNNLCRTNHRKRAAHDWPVIQWRVHDFGPGRGSFASQGEPPPCGCGQDAWHIRVGGA